MRIPASVAVLSLLAATAYAQTPTAPTTPAPVPTPMAAPAAPAMDLSTFLKQPEYRARVIDTARNQIKQVLPACATGTFTPTTKLSIYDRPLFDKGQPYAGAWTQRIDVTGCGPTRQLNVLTQARTDAPMIVVGTMPGDTLTNPPMQRIALQYAQAVSARAAPPGCKQLAFTDTKFDGFIGLPSPDVTDGREGRPWREIWTMSACGQDYDMALIFSPNAQGTALSGENPVKHKG